MTLHSNRGKQDNRQAGVCWCHAGRVMGLEVTGGSWFRAGGWAGLLCGGAFGQRLSEGTTSKP